MVACAIFFGQSAYEVLMHRVCPLVYTGDRPCVDDVVINGHYAQYSLHLGSGGIHRLPGGALSILPVHAQHPGRIFLPFAEDDPKTAEIVSKVLLLARDEAIQDPMILDQLGADPKKRPAWILQLMATANAISKPPKKKANKETPSGDTQETESEASAGIKR